MKIESVKTFLLRGDLTGRPRGFAQMMGSRGTPRSAILVKITTDDGVVGWGQIGAPAQRFVATAMDLEIAPKLIGKDPFLIAQIWQEVVGSFSPYGVQGAILQALSGVDVALWDIKAKAMGVPVWQLLGAKYRDRVDAYASGPYYFADEVIPDDVAAEAVSFTEAGYRALKVKIGALDPKEDIRRVESVRDAVGGDILIMVDANQAYTAHTAIRVGKELERLDIRWFEEPVPSTDLAGYARVRQALSIPIAGGEVEWTRFGFRDLITRGHVDIVQPDLANSGGFTECVRIATLADTFGVQVMPHVVSSTPLAFAAALHWLATLRDFPGARESPLFTQRPLLEHHQQSNPFTAMLVDPGFLEVTDGSLAIPNSPGLGVEVNEEALSHFVV